MDFLMEMWNTDRKNSTGILTMYMNPELLQIRIRACSTRSASAPGRSLAQYQVEKSGAVSLVKDERPDVTVCGVIRPKTVSEYDTAMKDNQRRFEEWFARQQGIGWRNIYIQDEEPEGAVDGSIWIGGK